MMVLENVRTFQAVGEHEGLVVEQLASGAISDDLAMIEQDNAWTEFDDQLEVVRGDQFRRCECSAATPSILVCRPDRGRWSVRRAPTRADAHASTPARQTRLFSPRLEMMRRAHFVAGESDLRQGRRCR